MTAAILTAMVDCLPHVRKLARGEHQAAVAHGIKLLMPHLAPAEHRAILRGVVRHQVYNSAFRSLQKRWPRVKIAAARCVPVEMSPAVAALLESDRPVLIAMPHVGPVYFAFTVLLKALRGRRVFGPHTNASAFVQANVAYLRRLGVTSFFSTDTSTRMLARVLQTEPRVAVVIPFDYLPAGKRRTVELFGTRLAVAYGIAGLAEMSDAATLFACWQWEGRFPRLVIAGPYSIDRSLERGRRKAAFMSGLFGNLEAAIRKHPDHWTQWAAVVAAAELARVGSGQGAASR